MQNLLLDPVKKDYVLTPTGSSIPTDNVTVASYIALQIPQNQWLYGDPNQGSQLYTLDHAKRTTTLEQQVSGYVTDALDRQVVSTGQASAIQFENLAATRTSSSNQVEVIPRETQVSNQFNFVAV